MRGKGKREKIGKKLWEVADRKIFRKFGLEFLYVIFNFCTDES